MVEQPAIPLTVIMGRANLAESARSIAAAAAAIYHTRPEARFLSALRTDIPGGADVDQALEDAAAEHPGERGVSRHLRDEGEWWQLREFVAHRSIYHLKEADPHAWAIPRLHGRAKASLVAVEFDEFGAGRAERMHARLFADLMEGTGLDPSYGRYLDAVPAVTLATVNSAIEA